VNDNKIIVIIEVDSTFHEMDFTAGYASLLTERKEHKYRVIGISWPPLSLSLFLVIF
jgi:hypothetical protein